MGWDAEIIGSSSAQYNCHGYAWHVSDGGNLVYINTPINYFLGDSATYIQSTNTYDSLRKIVYYYEYAGGHSAISTNTHNYVISKWGCTGPLVRHYIYHWPWIGESAPDSATFYEIAIYGYDNVNVGGTLNLTTLNITNATYNWSGDDYYICGTGNTYQGIIIGLYPTPTTPYTIRSPVKVEITSPYSNTTVKGDRKNYISVSSDTLPFISGTGRLVCSSGTSFNIENLPQGWTIEWDCGAYLTRNSLQGSNPCTFSSTGDGSSWVSAIVHPACGGIKLEKYDVWSGKPLLNVSGPSEGYIYNTYTFYANPGFYSNPVDYEWILNPLLNNHVYNYGYYADIAFYDSYMGYQVVSRAKNACCGSGVWGDWSLTNIDIYEDNNFLISPNPASEFITVTLQRPTNAGEIENSISLYTVRIFDTYGNMMYSSIKSGYSFTLPVSHFMNGNYFVQITDGRVISVLMLVIKH